MEIPGRYSGFLPVWTASRDKCSVTFRGGLTIRALGHCSRARGQ
ncbi:unnamed protein product [Staurois parvus]|uniref:Uncharacterized protein n=1 Tax=Staurois parvus TaxID=386267 RepID=A0ABN9DNZ1_9NEOB|nr:unnamed protein product [Staurois parvus]